MVTIGVFSVTIKENPLSALEAFTLPREDVVPFSRFLLSEMHLDGVVVISTCNRVEIILSADHGLEEDFDEEVLDSFARFTGREEVREAAVTGYLGDNALVRLMEVACALDSVVVGEHQVIRQVKDAYLTAKQAETVDGSLRKAFDHAFRCAKRARQDSEIYEGALSMATLAVEEFQRHFSDPSHVQAAIVGSGQMTQVLSMHLAKIGVMNPVYVNRSVEKVQEFADKYGGAAVSLDEFLKGRRAVDAVFTSTASEEPIFTSGIVRARPKPPNGDKLLFVDLAVPRDVDPEVEDVEGVSLVDVELLRSRRHANEEAKRDQIVLIRSIILDTLHELRDALGKRELDRSLVTMRETGESVARSEAARYLEKQLRHLDDKDKELIRKMALGIGRKASKLPLRGIRAMIAACKAKGHGASCLDKLHETVNEGGHS